MWLFLPEEPPGFFPLGGTRAMLLSRHRTRTQSEFTTAFLSDGSHEVGGVGGWYLEQWEGKRKSVRPGSTQRLLRSRFENPRAEILLLFVCLAMTC